MIKALAGTFSSDKYLQVNINAINKKIVSNKNSNVKVYMLISK